MSAERKRVSENSQWNSIWHRWGPFLSERQWGTVREDYSEHGSAWDYFSHDQARSRAYRWGEDGLGGISDRHCLFCFSFALWNGKDPILKERLFGLTNSEGNHGEDVKECYYYLDSTPTHSYMKFLYKYPQNPYPYADLVHENARRGGHDPEYELIDTGIFDQNEYFDFYVEYAKEDPSNTLIRATVVNRAEKPASLTILPQLVLRNTWSWSGEGEKSKLSRDKKKNAIATLIKRYGELWFHYEGGEEFLFTENETNKQKLYGVPNESPYVKDAFHDFVIHGCHEAVNPKEEGTKAAKVYRVEVPPGESRVIKMKLSTSGEPVDFGASFDALFEERIQEADEFYASVTQGLSGDDALIQRQAFAGLMWTKQFYYYDVDHWLDGDSGEAPPPLSRKRGRNKGWRHFHSAEVMSMPDKWEYPWFAAWDLAFHTVPIAMIDPHFAKEQLILLLREWFMHPNGQIAAYEWSFDDVNPPVLAWAAYRVFKIEKRLTGKPDYAFLSRVFHKLMINFTWWVNRKDAEENNIFEGGFLGLDNIGLFDRNLALPDGMTLEQSDATSWMAMFCLNMLAMALDLAVYDEAYSDTASKFFEHFILISQAMNNLGNEEDTLWDEVDGFYYDRIKFSDGRFQHLKVRSLVGLIPLLAVTTLEPEMLKKLPRFKRRMDWFLENRPELVKNIDFSLREGHENRLLLSLVPRNKLKRIFARMLDENEFLSPYGIRSLSKCYERSPYHVQVGSTDYRIAYEPAESASTMFGGNSNWRGPIWFPVTYLILEALQKFDFYFGSSFKVECPTGSKQEMDLWEVSLELERRMCNIFRIDPENGCRPVFGGTMKYQKDPNFRDHILFNEYFHGDNGAGIGASHQTGWTALIAKIIDQLFRADGNLKTQATKMGRHL